MSSQFYEDIIREDFKVFVFFFSLFLCGPFLKSLPNLLQYCFCFMIWFFHHEAHKIFLAQ